jgi:tRNA(Arg) A34 adenosine deaminase TadA
MILSSFDGERAKRFLRRAVELGRTGVEARDGGPFGAVIARGDVIIGEGWNRVIGTGDPTAHAEMVAIRDACRRAGDYRLKGCDLYTSFEPCPMCLGAVYWARIDRVFYCIGRDGAAEIGFDDRFIYEQLVLPPEEQAVPCIRVPDDEAARLAAAYTADPGRARY